MLSRSFSLTLALEAICPTDIAGVSSIKGKLCISFCVTTSFENSSSSMSPLLNL